MANSLQRDIQIGEVVILKKEIFLPEYQDLESRLFRCLGGYGLHISTMGTALYGQYLDEDPQDENGTGYRECSMDIDKEETEKYQQEVLKRSRGEY